MNIYKKKQQKESTISCYNQRKQTDKNGKDRTQWATSVQITVKMKNMTQYHGHETGEKKRCMVCSIIRQREKEGRRT